MIVTGVIAAVVGVLGLGTTLVIHIIKAAEDKGHTKARIEALEKGHDAIHETHQILPEFRAALSAMTKTVEKLDHTMNNLLMGRIELPGRRSRGLLNETCSAMRARLPARARRLRAARL